jgi:hypothetical protein
MSFILTKNRLVRRVAVFRIRSELDAALMSQLGQYSFLSLAV